MEGSLSLQKFAVSRPVRRIAWRSFGAVESGERTIAEEMPVSFAYQGTGYAVMLATPADLDDFALGFSLAEGIVKSADEIEAVEILRQPAGIILRIALASRRAELFWERRRYLAGPSGCGLCGIESLSEAVRAMPRVAGDLMLPCSAVAEALENLARRQALNRETRSVHAAAFWHPGLGLLGLREDIGRHNALDKLVGALAHARIAAADGAILLTSRVSVEMVQKTAMAGAAVLVAISAPTTLAVRVADEAGITLAAVARPDGFEIFTHPWRFMVGT